MSLTVMKILSKNKDIWSCLIKHNESQLKAELISTNSLSEKTDYTFEMEYLGILDVETIEAYQDSINGIFMEGEKISIIGRIITILDSNGETFYDLYLQNFADFIMIRGSDIPKNEYKIDIGLKVIFKEVIFHPNT